MHNVGDKYMTTSNGEVHTLTCDCQQDDTARPFYIRSNQALNKIDIVSISILTHTGN